MCRESVSSSGQARLISRVSQSITVAAEDHRGTQTQAKQIKQVEEEERKTCLHGYTGTRTKIRALSLLFVAGAKKGEVLDSIEK